MKFDIIKLLIFFLYKCSRNKYGYSWCYNILYIDAKLQSFSLQTFFLEDIFSDIRQMSNIRLKEITFLDIQCYIRSGYSISDNFTIRCILIKYIESISIRLSFFRSIMEQVGILIGVHFDLIRGKRTVRNLK